MIQTLRRYYYSQDNLKNFVPAINTPINFKNSEQRKDAKKRRTVQWFFFDSYFFRVFVLTIASIFPVSAFTVAITFISFAIPVTIAIVAPGTPPLTIPFAVPLAIALSPVARSLVSLYLFDIGIRQTFATSPAFPIAGPAPGPSLAVTRPSALSIQTIAISEKETEVSI